MRGREFFENLLSPFTGRRESLSAGRFRGCRPRLEPSPTLHTASRRLKIASTLLRPQPFRMV